MLSLVHPNQSKTAEAISIPLNGDAVNVLIKQKDSHPTFVFTFNGKPILRANQSAWRKLVKRAGIDDFRFHDLRHT